VIGDREDDENYVLGQTYRALRLSNGSIVVESAMSAEAWLRLFDSTGRFTRAFGRNGRGPGELSVATIHAVLPGDTIVAGSHREGYSYFTRDGEFVSSGEWFDSNRISAYDYMDLGIFGDRSVLLSGGAMDMNAGLSHVSLYIVDSSGKKVRPIGKFAYGVRQKGGKWMEFTPYASHFVTPTRFYYTLGADFSYEVYDARGRLERIVRRKWTPRRITSRDIEEHIRRHMRGVSLHGVARGTHDDSVHTAKHAKYYRSAEYAKVLPAIGAILVDPIGNVWTRQCQIEEAGGAWFYTTPKRPSIWSVFDPSGRWLGEVTMPPNFLPKQVGADFVLGIATDDDGNQTVVLYRLDKGPIRNGER
jgi:hypothetical protein